MRERTYFAELCLIQIATPSEIVCADPLGARDKADRPGDRFWDSLMRPEWVVHSARQDIEVVYQLAEKMPARIFDTQVAAAFLGMQPQIGYAGLVKELFDVELDKSHTRANWTKRPIADELLRYAAEDVQYLLPACEELTHRLENAGRLQWALEDSQQLLDPALYDIDPAAAVARLKAARNLRGRVRAAAEGLATWREKEALRTNRPRQWIIRDNTLVALAIEKPSSMSELAQIEGLAEKTIRRAGKDLLRILAEATDDASGYQPPRRPDEKQKAALKEMQRRVAAIGESVGVAAEVLAAKKELSAAMLGDRSGRIFRGWRKALFGDELLSVLENA